MIEKREGRGTYGTPTTYTHMYMKTHTHTYENTHTHTHTHMCIHTLSPYLYLSLANFCMWLHVLAMPSSSLHLYVRGGGGGAYLVLCNNGVQTFKVLHTNQRGQQILHRLLCPTHKGHQGLPPALKGPPDVLYQF